MAGPKPLRMKNKLYLYQIYELRDRLIKGNFLHSNVQLYCLGYNDRSKYFEKN